MHNAAFSRVRNTTCPRDKFELALVPLLADGEIEGAGHDQDGTNRIGMPMGHDFHPRWKFDAVDVQAGLRRVAEKRDVLRRSGKSFS